MVDYPATQSFIIENTGGADLTLDALSFLNITGTDAADFSNVGDSSGYTLAAGDLIVVDLAFSPLSAGSKTATVTINSDDVDEGSFSFTVSGTAIAKTADCEIPGADFETSFEGGVPTTDFFSLTGVRNYEAPTAWDAVVSKAFAIFDIPVNVEISADANSGSGALRLFSDGNGIGDLSTSFQCGTEFTSLKGFYKFSGAGVDSAFVAISSGGYGSATDDNSDTLYITADAGTYTEFSLPIPYDVNSIDSLVIYLATTTNGVATEFLVDDLSLETSVASDPDFVTVWKSDNPGASASNQITIPTEGSGYNYTVNWEEVGNPSNNGSLGFNVSSSVSVTFPSPGTYRVRISGDFPRIYFPNTSDKTKIIDVENWGDIQWSSMENAFSGCSNLNISATDAPDLSNVTSMKGMFSSCVIFNGDIGHWNTSNVTDMTGTFENARSFNHDISTWNVNNVTLMRNMFSNAVNFNQPLAGWDVSNVTHMLAMFKSATNFNQPLNPD
jgi:surface protein